MSEAKSVPKAERPLTRKQRRFVAEYLKDCNGTQAAIRAGYSEKRADATAADLLGNRSVRARVDAALADVCGRCGLSAEWVVKRLMARAEKMAALSDAADVEARDRASAGAAETRALELLGKYQRMFTERHEVTGSNGGPFRLVLTVVDSAEPGTQGAHGSANGNTAP